MKYILTTTFDTVRGQMTQPPQFAENDAAAIRDWSYAIKQLSQDKDCRIPVTDLQLFKIGEIDTETRVITPCNEFLANGGQFQKVGD